MLIPSIDLMGGQTVQLVGGRDKALDAGDPAPIARRFGLAREIAVIDLDAAIGTPEHPSNRHLIEPLLRDHACRVGGGIRSYEAALSWLDAGAAKVIIGTAATPVLLKKLPRERLIAAVDCFNGEVVVKGWREGTGRRVEDMLRELAPYVGGFLVTFVEREGRMQGLPIDQAAALRSAVGDAKLTVAGGVASASEIAELDRLGLDAQVGMAIYTGFIDFADALIAPLTTDRPDGLYPTVVCDEQGHALGLAYSSRESLREACRTQQGVYFSRSRGELWVKGKTSGDTQELLRIDLDCDRDAVRFTVRQKGVGFCHKDTATCWGEFGGIAGLEATLAARRVSAPAGSYSRRLFDDAALLRSKLVEEAGELARELTSSQAAADRQRVVEEAADVLYFTLVALARQGCGMDDVAAELERRTRRVTRRKGDAKASTGEVKAKGEEKPWAS